MNIKIVRYRKKTDTVDGHLYIEGMRICDCAENAKTAIKTGTYPVVITKCHQHARKMPVILINGEGVEGMAAIAKGNNPSPSPKCDCCEKLDFVSNNTSLPLYCPMLKPGNGVYNRTDGAIIVGTYLAPGCLTHPKEAFETIYDRLRKSAERGHELTLTIVENYPKPPRHELTNFEMGQQILRQF